MEPYSNMHQAAGKRARAARSSPGRRGAIFLPRAGLAALLPWLACSAQRDSVATTIRIITPLLLLRLVAPHSAGGAAALKGIRAAMPVSAVATAAPTRWSGPARMAGAASAPSVRGSAQSSATRGGWCPATAAAGGRQSRRRTVVRSGKKPSIGDGMLDMLQGAVGPVRLSRPAARRRNYKLSPLPVRQRASRHARTRARFTRRR